MAALEQQGIPVSYLLFEESSRMPEGGERDRRLEAELVFFGDMLGFTPAGDVRPSTVGDLRPWLKASADYEFELADGQPQDGRASRPCR